MSEKLYAPALKGWVAMELVEPYLLGSQCPACGTWFFPRIDRCRNPMCASSASGGEETDFAELSRTGALWSYTTAAYPPPPPFVVKDPFEPFAIAAVELKRERMVVLGQVAEGFGVDDLEAGMEMELALEALHETEEERKMIWKWRPVKGKAGRRTKAPRIAPPRRASPTRKRGKPSAPDRDIAIIGVGMTPWSKEGRYFTEYAVAAAREALADAGVDWRDIRFVSGGATIRCGYPGYVAGASIAQALGWQGAEVNTSYAACASGSQALAAARGKILSGECDAALVVGADTTPKGFLAPAKGDRPDDPDWVRFYLGIANPAYFGLYARRRMALYGDTQEDFAKVKIKNAAAGQHNPRARYRKAFTMADIAASPMVADPLRLMDVCATSDGGAALIVSSVEYARKIGKGDAPRIAAISTITPTFASSTVEMPDLATDSAAAKGVEPVPYRAQIAKKAYEEAGVDPADIGLAEVYDLSTALELDWMEDLGLCEPGAAAALLRAGETAAGGRIPVNPSGGLASFGEAVPAQALAQVCELAWQLRGEAGRRQVADAKVGITANQGLFGHGSAVIVKR